MLSRREIERLKKEGEKCLWHSTRGIRGLVKDWLNLMVWDFSQLTHSEFPGYMDLKDWVLKWLTTKFDQTMEVYGVDVIRIGKKRFQSGKEIAEWIMQNEEDLMDYILQELYTTYTINHF